MRRIRGLAFALAACMTLALPMSAAYGQLGQPVNQVAVSEELGEAFDSAMLVDVKTGAVLYAKNEHAAFSPTGGAVQLMNAYIAACEAEWEREIAPLDAVEDLPSSARTIGIDPSTGERWVIKDLVAAMMLYGAQDAALMLSDHVSSSQQEYIGLMNSYAEELGMTETVYADALGGYSAGQTTTVYDLMLLSMAALAEEDLKDVITSDIHSTLNGRRIESRMRIMDEGSDTYDPRVRGLGEGSTSRSGTNSLIFMVEDAQEWMLVTYSEGDDVAENEEAATELFDFLSNRYTHLDLAPLADEKLRQEEVISSDGSVVSLNSLPCLITAEQTAAEEIMQGTFTLGKMPPMPGPVTEGDEVGEVDIMFYDNTIAALKLVAGRVQNSAAGVMMLQDGENGGIPIYTAEDWLAMQKPPTFVDQYGFYIVTGGVVLLAVIVLAVGITLRRKMR